MTRRTEGRSLAAIMMAASAVRKELAARTREAAGPHPLTALSDQALSAVRALRAMSPATYAQFAPQLTAVERALVEPPQDDGDP